MQARVPDGLQDRIYRAVAPGVDREAAQAKAAESPTAHFAQQELGDGMRDQYLTPEKQQDNPTAEAERNMSDALWGYEFKRILSQQSTTGEVSELMSAVRQAAEATPPSKFGWVAAVRDHVAKLMNFLRGNGAGETARQLDRLHAELDRIVKNAKPDENSPTGAPTEIKDAGGGPNGSDPGVIASSPEHLSAERIRDQIASGFSERPRAALASHLIGAHYEKAAGDPGMKPEAAAQLRARAVAHVGREMQARGVSADDAARPYGPEGWVQTGRSVSLRVPETASFPNWPAPTTKFSPPTWPAKFRNKSAPGWEPIP